MEILYLKKLQEFVNRTAQMNYLAAVSLNNFTASSAALTDF